MALLLTTQWFGTFILEDGNVIGKKEFPMEAGEIAERLRLLQSRGVLEDEIELVEGLSPEQREILKADDERLSGLAVGIVDKIDLDPGDFGYDPGLLREASLLLARSAVSVKVDKDKHISQAIALSEELTKYRNILCERLAEWYNIYFPEAVSFADHDDLVSALAESEVREDVARKLENQELLEKNTGSDVGEEEMRQYGALAGLIADVDGALAGSHEYIKRSMEDLAPNLTALAGPNVGAKLISQAGSLERLSKMPASTVQMLGAEKALFRFLKHKGQPPKHGSIFMHPVIHSAPYWQRGKIARTFAAKIALAVKVDYHSGRDISEELQKQLDRQFELIRQKYPEPPERPVTKAEGPKRRGKKGKRGKKKRGRR